MTAIFYALLITAVAEVVFAVVLVVRSRRR